MAVIKIVPMPGAEGQQGETGAVGPQGPQGETGATGPAGADAVWYYNGEYNPGASYVIGDVVTYDGQLWYRKHANGGNVGDTPSEGFIWDLLAAKGADFNAGNGLVVTGLIDDPVINPAGTMSLSVQDGYTALVDLVALSATFNGDVQITNLGPEGNGTGERIFTVETPTTINNDLTVTNDATINGLTVGRGLGGNDYNTVVGLGALENNTPGNAQGFANTAIGRDALGDNTTGAWNTAVGARTLSSNNTGYNNVAVGNSGLEFNTTGHDNTAVGGYSLPKNTTGINNSALGAHTLVENTTGSENTAVGSLALNENTTGFRNTAVGVDALGDNTTGSRNTALGNNALENNTTGELNTAVGLSALNKNTIGHSNVAIGSLSLHENTTGIANTALGSDSLYVNTNGNYNTAVGNAALGIATSPNYNTAVGHASLISNNGAANTAIGVDAGRGNINGERNIFIGYQSGRNETGSDKLYIDVNDTATPLIYGDFATDTLVVNGTLYSGGTSADDEVVTFGDLKNGTMNYSNSPVPPTHNGSVGDLKNDIRYDATHLYICVEDYTDGTAIIWKRINWASGNW